MSSSTNPSRVEEPGETDGVGDGLKTFVQVYAACVEPRKTQPIAIPAMATAAIVMIAVRYRSKKLGGGVTRPRSRRPARGVPLGPVLGRRGPDRLPPLPWLVPAAPWLLPAAPAAEAE